MASKSFWLLTVAFLSLCVAAISALILFASDGPHDRAPFTCAIGSVLALVILRHEARRDVDAVLTLLAAISFILAVTIGVYLGVEKAPSLVPKIAVGLSGCIGVACVATLLRHRRSTSPAFPNVITQLTGGARIFETEGVQFCGWVESGTSDSPHRIKVLLQNCFDTPRRVEVLLDAAGHAEHLRFAPTHTVELGAAGVAAVTFPVVAVSHGTHRLYITLDVSDGGGKRVRKYRAPVATRRVSTGATLAMLATGTLLYGGGVFVSIEQPASDWTTELPPPSCDVVWEPRVGKGGNSLIA